MVDEKKKEKYILIDLGIAIYDGRKVDEANTVRLSKIKKNKRNRSIVTPVVSKKGGKGTMYSKLRRCFQLK